MSDNDSLTNIRNILGFLLAGFGAILSFIGVRSSEVTTILRNDSWQVSLIALILLAGILAAVGAILNNSRKKVYPISALALGLFLLGVGALVIFFIPIGPSQFTASGTISLVIGCVFVLAGAAAQAGMPFLVDGHTAPSIKNDNIASSGRRHGWRRRLWEKSARKWNVGIIDVLIVTSVLLTGIAAYGAMRLESKSQLSFSSQVGASFSIDGSVATASVDIAATKLPQVDWIFIDVYAVPAKAINLINECRMYVIPYLERTSSIAFAPQALHSGTASADIAHCMTDPCLYFAGEQEYYTYNFPDFCKVLFDGSIVPNAAGDVDETLRVPFLMTIYQDIDIRAEVCSPDPMESCIGSASGQNSRLDWIISNSQITVAS